MGLSRGRGARVRVAAWLVVGLVVALTLVDVGSVVLTKMRVDDDLKSAGFAGATAIQGGQTAQTAYAAAVADLDEGEQIVTETFAVGPAGGVTLTLRKTAPTVVLKHLSFLDGFTEVEETYEQPRIGY
jgi:hypothetical protein